MSINEDHVTRTVRSWIASPEPADPEPLLGKVFAAVETTRQRQPRWRLPRLLASGLLPVVGAAAVAASIVLIAFLAGGLVPRGSTAPGAHPSATASPTAAATPVSTQTGQIKGLPPEGSAPSSTKPGRLIVELSSGRHFSAMWVYDDGRVITFHHAALPAMGDAYIGLTEQHLTPAGAEMLRVHIADTGLFDTDLNLARETGYAPFLEIGVDNGSEFVHATWAVRTVYSVGTDAPVATEQEARVLEDLEQLLSTLPASWPADAWADANAVAYVPSHYGICFRGFPTAWPQERVLDALPTALATLVRNAPATGADDTSGVPACALLTVHDAWTLARGLGQAGITRQQPEAGAYWLRYVVGDPSPMSTNNGLWISFCPVLPDGVATWQGPG